MHPSKDSSKLSSARFLSFIALTACVACISVTYVNKDTGTSNTTSSINTEYGAITRTISHAEQKFHQSGFGGIRNINHPAGARARRKLSEANVIVPVAANPFATPSLSHENIQNFRGHYVHDEHRSPFASFLYNKPKEELEAVQKDYEKRMSNIREEWGAWDLNDEHPEIRPIANFDKIPYKDLENDKFPAKSWQMDKKYVKDFIAEGKKLVNRVREGIYAEYGHPTKDLHSPEEIEARNKLFEIKVTDEIPPSNVRSPEGWAVINKNGLDMYARKLLHSMISNDEFYYVMGGHSAAAGHGNNFHQTYLMEFANIMEPVLHKLGVRLIARNLAMGGLGTTHFSLGADTLYGEADVMMWDSGMTEKSLDDQDLFHKQVMLGGERFPVLIGGHPVNLETETGGNLWYANIIENNSGIPVITSMDQAEKLPWAVQEFVCDATVKDLCGRGLLDECWVPRSDFTPTTGQAAHVGGKAGWHPGWRTHKYTGRKQTMLMLKALDRALEMWENGIENQGFPLKEEYWHVGNKYDTARSNLSMYINGEGVNTTGCEKRWKQRFGLDRACRMSIKGMGEFTPRNRGYHNSIRAHLKAAPNGYKPDYTEEALYDGVDVLPHEWKVPEGEIDVHAIAIVSTYAASELDHSWVDKNDKDAEEADNSRRMLRKAATERIAASVDDKASVSKDAVETKSRGLSSDGIVPGNGWYFQPSGTSPGYCDGSPVSWCKRSRGNNCLLYGHNDGRSAFEGDALSGWMVFTVPEVKEGLVFARMEYWHPRGNQHPITKDWTEVNNGVNNEGRRELKKPPIDWPKDMEVDIAANGKIITTYNYTEFSAMKGEMAYNEAYYLLMDDKDFITGDKAEAVEMGIRIRSEENPHNAAFGITHIYYA